MSLNWASDFSYSYFKRILQTGKSKFELHQFREAPQTIERFKTQAVGGRPLLFLRHDVDVSLKRAMIMANIEKDLGIGATYMVMTESSLYRVEDDTSFGLLRKIIDMGHEIGLHINPRTHKPHSLEAKIDSGCRKLENVTGAPVKTVSFHRPRKKDQHGPLMIGNRVNAYAKELQRSYLSDSGGRWRDGEPLPELLRFHEPLLQLLIHPIWWGYEHMQAKERLKTFVIEETGGSELRDKIIEMIGVEFDF
jgi:hypothetical protein